VRGIKNNWRGEWQQAAAIAEVQLGVISRPQLRGLGLSDTSIDKAITRGYLHPIFRSVFGVGHRPLSVHARYLAATIACGEGSVVSHGTAAWLLDLREWQPLDVDVIAPVECGRKIEGVRRRFVPPPSADEIEVRDGVPTTDPSRTIVDTAGILDHRGVANLIEEAATRGVLNVPRIDAILDGPRRRNTRKLLSQLEPWRRYKPGIIRLRSRMEAKLLPLLTEWGLPIPEINSGLRIGEDRFEIDFLWRREKVAVETDGRVHDNPRAGARDSKRNRALTNSGYRVRRIGWEELRDRPDAVLAELRTLLAPRR
jgi:very-short-patch-repair endonuclease